MYWCREVGVIDFALGDNAKRGGPALAERFRTMARTLHLGKTDRRRLPLVALRAQGEGRHPEKSQRRRCLARPDRLVELSVADGCHPNNPVPCAAADFERIFSEAFG